VVKELDRSQVQLRQLIQPQIEYYYRELYKTRPCYQYPLSLSRLMHLGRRSSHAVVSALPGKHGPGRGGRTAAGVLRPDSLQPEQIPPAVSDLPADEV